MKKSVTIIATGLYVAFSFSGCREFDMPEDVSEVQTAMERKRGQHHLFITKEAYMKLRGNHKLMLVEGKNTQSRMYQVPENTSWIQIYDEKSGDWRVTSQIERYTPVEYAPHLIPKTIYAGDLESTPITTINNLETITNKEHQQQHPESD